MKRLFQILALLVLVGCSTTSNDITQNLRPLPEGAESFQCDSGNRIIIEKTKDGGTQLDYRGEAIRMTQSEAENITVLEGEGLTWHEEGLQATLSGMWQEDGQPYTETCTRVLQPAN